MWTEPSICGASPLVRPLAEMRAALVDDHLEAPAHFGREFLGADRLLAQHQPFVAGRLHIVRHGLEAEIVGVGALDRLVLEGADAVEPGFVQPVEQQLENPPPSRRESRR